MFFAALLGALSWLPEAQRTPRLRDSIAGAALVLLLGVAQVWLRARTRGLRVEISLRAQHYLQASMQATVLAYWGWYWRPVYDAVPLLVAQLAFAYAFDMLLAWWRRDTYTLGFGPFPVIFSINLFLWFKPDWFYLQFCMIALGFAAKELIRWEKGGRQTHIFNPSSFPLAIASVVLLLFDQSDMTWGFLVANTEFYPPQMYLAIFLVGMPGQYLFGVTPMTMAAVVTTFAFSAIYYAVTGSFYFVDAHIPIAVFLGMHLLFTDPATSPRTELGRLFYGVLYGLTTVVLYDWLLRSNMPGFYDKLLQVPLLNLSVKLLDRLARSPMLQRIDPSKWGAALVPRRRHLAYMSVWAVAFVAMSASGYLGDQHPGQWTPFWEQACAAGKRGACDNLYYLQDISCEDGSGWACNEEGILLAQRYDNRTRAARVFERACGLRFSAACDNAVALTSAGTLRHDRPTAADYRFILKGSKGPIQDREPARLYARACTLGWPDACGVQ
jgi:hypothetical protein